MQPQALTRITGTILGVRRTDVPAREATADRKASEAFSYVEVDVLSDASGYDGQIADGLPAVIPVRDAVNGELHKLAVSSPRSRCDIYVRPYATWAQAKGRSFPIVAHRHVQLLATDAKAAA